MKHPLFQRLLICAGLAASINTSPAEVKLAGLFGNNMVLQRESAAPIWGSANPGEPITLTLGEEKADATADKDGKWKTAFHGLKPGSALTLTVAGTGNAITLKNVAVGDVWICSGQSNMEYRLAEKDEIASANDPDLRYLLTAYTPSLEPLTDLKSPWTPASPPEVERRTAVGYYFAKTLRKELGVPIGLIQSGWSGTMVEPWTPLDALDTVPQLGATAHQLLQEFRDLPADIEKFPGVYKAWQEKNGRTDPGNKGITAGWADPAFDAKDWAVTKTPGDWSKIGVPNGGVIWIRKTVQLPPEAANKDFNLTPGWTQDLSTVYFNGTEVGTGGMQPPYFWNEPTLFKVPGKLVKAGDNVIAIRILCQKPKNTGLAPGSRMGLRVTDPKSISDEWLAKVETEFPPLPPEALAAMPKPPKIKGEATSSTLFNGKIAPLIPFGIKGVIWYQGESNGGKGWAYRTAFPLMIGGWRTHWAQGDFPFYFVLLAAHGAPMQVAGEGDTRWAELREAQVLTSQKVPNTGFASAVDIGDAINIHPANKRDVGYRLALNALAKTYGKEIEFSGPNYESMSVEGNKIRLKFTHVAGGLVAKGGPLKQFAIAGEDKKWVWGNAVIDGETVVVSSDQVPAPVSVRYAWANNPEGCNLYNKAGLPATPFRTDDWPLGSFNQW